jgi:hypothetical protein
VTYELQRDGDRWEQRYWQSFLRDEFSAYEAVWAAYIVPLTGRPEHLHFKTDAELAVISRGHRDLCNAQLHYTTLIHLARAWELRQSQLPSVEAFTEAIVRLAAATDVADELLQRAVSPGTYSAWDESAKARRDWRKANDYPLQPIRDYRNRLLHGRVPPQIDVEVNGPLPGEPLYVPGTPARHFIALPKIGRETRYLDWRTVVGQPNLGLQALRVDADFAFVTNIVNEAWQDVLRYLQQRWLDTLLPALT